jgi:hypothetical protein
MTMKSEIAKDQSSARDDIDNKLNQIQALAGVLGGLAWQTNKHPDTDSEAFRFHGEHFCSAIESMAAETEETFKRYYKNVTDLQDGIIIPIGRLERRLTFLKNSARPEDLQLVEDTLKEIETLWEKAFLPLASIKNKYFAVLQRILRAREAAGAGQ